ncbi:MULTISPECIES: hypothetical protein [unclassified Paenibacillus]|uniref:hypothetical protein n=1 Tax=unclassified Paenibacillus TaxID=185978 RepID=UPI002F3E27AB
MMKIITFKNRSVPVYCNKDNNALVEQIHHKLQDLELNFEFRRKWKRIHFIEVIHEVAILQYNDGTKLYMEVS